MAFTHDPSEYIKGLQQLLISDKKRIGFLFGAGTSLAKKNDRSLSVPSIVPLTKMIVDELAEQNAEYQILFDELKVELGESFNIESILTNLEQKRTIIGNGTLNGLNKEGFNTLIPSFKNLIRNKLSVHIDFPNDNVNDLIQTDFARWIGQINRKNPIEIFTTNYDYLFELGLEACSVPYYDGFSGSYKPFFNSDSVENMKFLPNQTKLWKVHGSLGWKDEADTNKIIRANSNSDDILIYPSVLKYKDSKKQPYESLMDRLSNYLKIDDSVLMVCGYSFGDEHINARIEAAINSNTTSHVLFLYYDKYWDDVENIYKYRFDENDSLYKFARTNSKVSVYAMRSAIIGGKHGEWQLKNEPTSDDMVLINLYYDEDLEIDSEIGQENTGNEIWNGMGEFILPGFVKLVGFLTDVLPENEIGQWGRNAR